MKLQGAECRRVGRAVADDTAGPDQPAGRAGARQRAPSAAAGHVNRHNGYIPVMAETAAGPWTIARLLAWTKDYLARSRVESPKLCAEILLSHALECERIQLFTRYETVPEEPALGRFREAVRRAAEGTPIAYITGRKEFFSLSFEVGPTVLIPRPETEILVERAISALRPLIPPTGSMSAQSETAVAGEKAGATNVAGLSASAKSMPTPPFTPSATAVTEQPTLTPTDEAIAVDGRLVPPRILDLCTGSGCVAIALARHLPSAALSASDISAGAIEIAQRNAGRHQLSARIDFRVGDLFAPWGAHTADVTAGADDAAFDLITCNPPYVGTDEAAALPAHVRDFEPHEALFAGADGLSVIRRLISEAPRYLRTRATSGLLLVEISYRQAGAVRGLLEAGGWRDIVSFMDGGGHERVFRARRPVG